MHYTPLGRKIALVLLCFGLSSWVYNEKTVQPLDSKSIKDSYSHQEDKPYNGVSFDNSTVEHMEDNNKKNPLVETVEVLYNDLRYRRVCTNVGLSSILCMIVRFPFAVQLQVNDTTIRYPKPFNSRFYDLNKEDVHVLSLSDWHACQENSNNYSTRDSHHEPPKSMYISNDIVLKECLEYKLKILLAEREDKSTTNSTSNTTAAATYDPVVYMWTRERHVHTSHTSESQQEQRQRATLFHATEHTSALENVYNFFGTNHQVIVVGASPAPAVTAGIQKLFGDNSNCVYRHVHRYPNHDCDRINQTHMHNVAETVSTKNEFPSTSKSTRQFRRQLASYPYQPFHTLQEPHINLGIIDWRLDSKDGNHKMPNVTILGTLLSTMNRSAESRNNFPYRNLTVIAEYPFAHIQGESMIDHQWDKIEFNQKNTVRYYMDVQERQSLLKKQGYQFQNLIAFDGLPQFYPTRTNAWTISLYTFKEKNFTYNGWIPDYGISCVGPLPTNSVLKEINQMSRNEFVQRGHNPQWYGRTWEFINQFWWQYRRDDRADGEPDHPSDCTHPIYFPFGAMGVHRYFIQAMIDDFYEND